MSIAAELWIEANYSNPAVFAAFMEKCGLGPIARPETLITKRDVGAVLTANPFNIATQWDDYLHDLVSRLSYDSPDPPFDRKEDME